MGFRFKCADFSHITCQPYKLVFCLVKRIGDVKIGIAWEIAIKYEPGRLPLPEPPAVYVAESMRRSGERHHEALAPLMASVEGRANLVPDAHLAALAIEHGLVLCSTDGDFARFNGLEWRNPLT